MSVKMKDKKEATNQKDKEEGTALGPSGVVVPESSSFTEVPETVPPTVKEHVEDVGHGIELNFDKRISQTVKHINKFESILEFKVTSKLKNSFFVSKEQMVKFTNQKEYIDALAKLSLKVMSMYDGLLVGVPKVLEPTFKRHRITDPNSIGFNIYSALEQMSLSDYEKDVLLLESLGCSDIEGEINEEKVDIICLPFEREMYERMHALNLERYSEIDVNQVWNWFKHLDNVFQFLKPLPYDLDHRYVRYLAPGPFVALNHFLRDNHFMWEVITDVWKEIVFKHVAVPTNSESKAFAELLEILQVRIGQFSTIQKYPSQITEEKGRDFVRKWLVAMLCGEFCEITYEVDLVNNSLAMMVDCLCLKLMVRKELVNRDTMIDVDNYLARYLVPALPGFTSAGYTFDFWTAKMREKNYLVANLGSCFRGQNASTYQSVFMTRDDGNGWGGAARSDKTDLPPNANLFLNRTKGWYFPCTGKILLSQEDSVNQFSRFEVFSTIVRMNGLKFIGAMANMARALPTIIEAISNRVVVFSALAYQVDEIQKKLGLMSISYPPFRENVSQMKVRLELKTASMMSALMTVDPYNVDIINYDFKFISYGWYVHEFMNELVTKYHFVKDRYVKPFYTRSDRLKILESLMTLDPGFMGVVFQKIGSSKIIDLFKMPDADVTRQDFSKKVKMAESFIKDNQNLFGFTEQPIFGKVEEHNDHLFRRFFLSPKPNKVYSIREIEKMAQLRQIQSALSKARNREESVGFSVPTRVVLQEEKGEIKQGELIDFSLNGGSLKFGDLSFFYTLNDDLIELDSNRWIYQENPFWGVEKMPLIENAAGKIKEFIGKVVVLKDGFTSFEDFTLASRS